MDKLIGFAPDADPTTAGVLTSVKNIVPYEYGVRGAPTAITPLSTPALANTCLGAATISKLDDSRRTFAGTTTKLYELSAGAWVDVSTGSYTGGVDTVWSFAQFGDSTLAADLSDTIQRSPGSGIFAPIATAPKAKIIFSIGAFVMALNTVDGTYGTSPDRWWCSAASDDTLWTPSVATLATTGRLVSAPGKIIAGGKLGEYAVAYKERAIYVGQFIGAPAVWDWLQVPGGEAGCVGQEAWCAIGSYHFIVGQDRFWRFDGSRPVPVGDGIVTRWFYDNSTPSTRYKTKCFFDAQVSIVWIFFCHGSSASINKALIFHVKTEQWGLVDIAIETAMHYVAAGITIDTMSSVHSTIAAFTDISFDSQYWQSGGRLLSVFNNSHQLQVLAGDTGSSSITTGDIGDDDVVSLLSKVRPRFAGLAPLTAVAETSSKMNSGDAFAIADTSSISDGRFDVLHSARWHKAVIDFTGNFKLTGLGYSLTPEGDV
jgi:hypothetical protein